MSEVVEVVENPLPSSVSFRSVAKFSVESNVSAQAESVKSDRTPCSSSEYLSKLFIFDSISVSFNIRLFLLQLFIHLFFPFTFPLIPNSIAQNFKSTNPVAIFFNHLVPIIVMMMVVSYYLMGVYASQAEKTQFDGSVWYPLLFFSLHRVTIAVKYASLSESEYRRLMITQNPENIRTYASQLFMLQAWGRSEHKQVTEFEIVSAALRCGAHIDALSFTLPSPQHGPNAAYQVNSWKAFLLNKPDATSADVCKDIQVVETASGLEASDSADDMSSDSLQELKVPLFAFCKRARSYVYEIVNISQPLTMLAFFFSALMTSIIFFGLASLLNENPSQQLSPWTITFVATSSFVNFLFVFVLFQFIFVCIYDVQRQCETARLLHCLIRMSSVCSDFQVDFGGGDDVQQRVKQRQAAVAKALWKSLAEENEKRHVPKKAMMDSLFVANAVKMLHRDEENGDMDEVDESTRRSLAGEIVLVEGDIVTELPRISMKFEQNLLCWAWARQILVPLGLRFRARLEIFVGLCLFFNLVLMAVTLVLVFESEGSSRRDAFSTPLLRQAVVSVSFISAFIVVYTALGARVNSVLNQHRVTLSSHLLRIREHIFDLTNLDRISRRSSSDTVLPFKFSADAPGALSAEVSRLRVVQSHIDHWRKVESTLLAVIDSVQAHNLHQPFKVLGMHAQFTVALSIASAIATFFVTIGSAYVTTSESGSGIQSSTI